MKAPGIIALICQLFFLLNPGFPQDRPEAEELNRIARADQQAMLHFPYYTKTANPSDYDIVYHRFNLEIDPAVLFLRGSVTTYVRVLQTDLQEFSFALSHALSVDSVVVHGHTVDYQHSVNDRLTIFLGETFPCGLVDSLSIYYHGTPEPGAGFGSFAQGFHAGEPIIWTLSEPYGSSDWWPCRDGLEDKIDSIDMVITTPIRYRVAGNGLLVGEMVAGTDKVYHWKHRYPIAPYLIAFAVTNYACYSDWCVTGTDSIEVLNYVYPENLENARKGTQDMIKVMQYFCQQFGPYPFREEKYGHAQFNMGGGMEHQTMSFMGGFGFEICSHELAHSWFGNMITCGSWHEIWLNEGFATYCAGLAYERFSPDLYWTIWKRNNISNITSAPDGAVYVADTTTVERIFSARLSYSKGAFLLHMLRWIMGDEMFFHAVNQYLQDPSLKYGFATTTDLKLHLEEASQLDLTGFFNDWYTGEGYPSYTILCYPMKGTQIQLTIHQEQSHPSVEFFEMPLPVLFKNESRDTLLVFDHRYSGEVFLADPGFEVDSVLFDPDQWIVSRANAVIMNPPVDPQRSLLTIPNPTHQVLALLTQVADIEKIEVFDLSGRQFQVPVATVIPHRSFELDLSSCPAGAYIVQVKASSGSYSRKIIKVD
ncbi:MAG: M1 family aminopeptidase [Bacteroidales bacterium]|nr:T9SS type A sorting domain-containing protein [Lentimicrobiaceae bacterium]MDD5694851.1 M1 family aminopeptidase [Bacteroidales bacterium]